MFLLNRRKRIAAPSTSSERGPSPSATRPTKRPRLEGAVDIRLAIGDCIDRDIACIQCNAVIAESPIAVSSNAVDKSRNFIVLLTTPDARVVSPSRTFAARKVPEVAKAQANALYANYRQFHNCSHDEDRVGIRLALSFHIYNLNLSAQKRRLNKAVHDWLSVAYDHDITTGIQQGLNQVFPSPEQDSGTKDKTIDTSLSAWVAWKRDGDPNSGDVHWLRDPDMLPSRIPTARNFTYDWNSKYDNNAAEEKLLGHADDLLRSLSMERAGDGKNRPILFVASCFGGLLLAKALHRASGLNSKYQDILKSTVGAAFLGTPFQGGHPGVVTAAQMRIAVAMEMGFEASSQLVKYLEAKGNDELDELVQTFCEMVNKPESRFPIICFYERHTMDFTAMMRDLSPEAKEELKKDSKGRLTSERSACLVGPHNRVFLDVSYQLKTMMQQAAETLEKKNWKYHESNKKQKDDLYLPDSESTVGCLRSLAFPDIYSRYNGVIPAFKGTCAWLHDNQSFKNWASDRWGLLWIRGKPGAGKSTLLKYALDETTVAVRASGRNDLIISFFFHGRGHELQKTRKGFCRSLLHQLLSKSPGAFSSLIDTYVEREKNIGKAGQRWEWDENELWGFLERGLPNILNSFPVVLFVDALDECDEEVSINLVNDFLTLLEAQEKSPSGFRICFSCRHYPILEPEYRSNNGLTISVEDGNSADIKKYVEKRLSDLPPDHRDYVSLIVLRARGIFLWAHLVVKKVLYLRSRKRGRREIEQEIGKIPQDLDKLYRRLIEELEERPQTLKLIQWICFSKEPLSSSEIQWAMAINPDYRHNTLQECRNAVGFIGDDDIDGRIKVLSCGLAEVIRSEGKTVQFIHQSVMDFFTTTGLAILAEKSMSADQISIEANYCITRSCVQCIAMEEFSEVKIWKWDREHWEEVMLSFPLLIYAVLTWVHHAKQAEGIAPTGYFLDLFDFPSKQLLERWEFVRSMMSRPTFGYCYKGGGLLSASLEFNLTHTAWAIIHRIGDDEASLNARNSSGRTPLAIAVQNGYADICVALINAGAELNAKDLCGDTPLAIAVWKEYDDICVVLINAGADLNAEDLGGNTPLFYAAKLGNERIIQLLLNAGAMVDYKNECGETALMSASSKEAAAALVGAKVDVNIKDHEGYTPLWKAVRFRRRDVVHFLIASGAGVDLKNNYHRTPLWAAANWGHEAIVRDLLAAGAEVDPEGVWGTPLCVAANEGYKAIVKDLLAAGAEIDACYDNPETWTDTPLWIAASNGYEDVVKLLLAAKPRVNIGNTYNQTPLYKAVCGGHEAIVRHLLAAGADVNSVRDGWTPLQSTSGFEDIVQRLLAAGAMVNRKDPDGETPLCLAAAYGYKTIVRLLLAANAQVDLKGDGRKTATWRAAASGSEGILQLLLNTGKVDINCKDNDDRSPLWAAVARGRTAVVRLLLNIDGVDVNSKDNDGRPPLWAAAERGRPAVTRTFLETEGVNKSPRGGWIPLLPISPRKRKDTIQILHDFGIVNVNLDPD
ncbi:ankyrin repeat-containing domain protein [Nemania sp. FL0031]|nr:ankyrin repeat-containing domain protein [Nemania sp. FL0031]